MTALDKIYTVIGYSKDGHVRGEFSTDRADFSPFPGKIVEYTRTASIPAPGADYVAELDRIWCRDIDGTGSLHMCSKGDAGAIEFVPRAALSARPTDTRSERLRGIVMSYDAANPMRSADLHGGNCRCHRCDIDRIRAIIGVQANE
jgi:hypothetical protein